MQDFAKYLVSKQFVSKKVSYFYRLWVINLYDYIGKKPASLSILSRIGGIPSKLDMERVGHPIGETLIYEGENPDFWIRYRWSANF